MPKEIVYSTYKDAPKVGVSWSRPPEGHVQVATVAEPGQTLDPEDLLVSNGWYATLDREGINKLIRTLRRARDQAYGADA